MVRSSIPPAKNSNPMGVGQPDRGQTTQARNIFWMAVTLLGIVSLFTLYTLYLSFQTGAWQLVTISTAELAYAGALAYATYLSWRNRVDLAVKIVAGGLVGLGLIATSLIANVGLVVGFAIVIASWAITAQLSDQRWNSVLLVAGFTIGIIAGALELFPLPTQLVVPELQSLAPWMAVVIGLAFITLVFWQFRSYNLQAKLITVFLIVTMVSVGIVAFLNNRTTSADLTRNVGSTLKSLAGSQGTFIGDSLERQVDNLKFLGLNKVLQAKIAGRNSTYTDSPAAIEAQLRRLDDAWRIGDATDPTIQIHFNRITNAGALELNEFQQLFPAHVEVFVTDRYGGLVAATNRTSDYYQADEEWWQAAFNEGQGAVFIDQPKHDESSATFGVNMAVPVYATNSREVIGVLRTTYRIEPILEILDRVKLGQTGQAELYIPGGQELKAGDPKIEPADDLSPDSLAQLLANQMDFVEAEDAEELIPILVSAAPVKAVTNDSAIDDLNWTVIVHQSRREALAPLQVQLRNTVFTALVIIGLVAIAAVILAQILAGPITRLTAAAGQVAGGELMVQAEVESKDEIGQLAAAFNMMTGRLRETIDTLEEEVTDRTRQLETVVDVSHRLVSILDLSDLMRQVVTLTKETFDYYHVHIYLLEDNTLLMAEGYGEAGAEMKRQGHHISLDTSQSLVARAARERQVIIVGDVQDDPNWLPNPLLPDTRSEMAVPVLLGQEIVGVLDVQSDKVAGLTAEDESTLQALANQVATAVRNARAFAQTQEALYEAQRLQRLYTGEAWEQFGTARATTDFEFRQSTVPPLRDVPTPEAMAALQQEQTITLIANGQSKLNESPEEIPAESQPSPQAKNALATPLKLRDEIIGVLGIHDENPDRRWSEEEIALIEAVSEQMTLALENARLFEHTQRDAWRNQMVSETTSQVWASADIEEVMKAAVAELGNRLRASEVVIRLGVGAEFDQEA